MVLDKHRNRKMFWTGAASFSNFVDKTLSFVSAKATGGESFSSRILGLLPPGQPQEKCACACRVSWSFPGWASWVIASFVAEGNTHASLVLASWSECILGDGRSNLDKGYSQHRPINPETFISMSEFRISHLKAFLGHE